MNCMLAILALVILRREFLHRQQQIMQRWKRKQFWIRPIFQRRQEHGASNNLVQEPLYENQKNK